MLDVARGDLNGHVPVGVIVTQYGNKQGHASGTGGREGGCGGAAGLEEFQFALKTTGEAAAAAMAAVAAATARRACPQGGGGQPAWGNSQTGGRRALWGQHTRSMHSMQSVPAPALRAGTPSPARIKCPRSRHTDQVLVKQALVCQPRAACRRQQRRGATSGHRGSERRGRQSWPPQWPPPP